MKKMKTKKKEFIEIVFVLGLALIDYIFNEEIRERKFSVSAWLISVDDFSVSIFFSVLSSF